MTDDTRAAMKMARDSAAEIWRTSDFKAFAVVRIAGCLVVGFAIAVAIVVLRLALD